MRTALVRHETSRALGPVGIIGSALLIVYSVRFALSLDLSTFQPHYSDAYNAAAKKTVMADAVWCCILFSLGARLFGFSLRRFFGLADHPRLPRWLRLGVWSVAGISLFILVVRSLVRTNDYLTGDAGGPTFGLMLALVVWASLATSLPRSIWTGVLALRTRLIVLAAKRVADENASSTNEEHCRVDGVIAPSKLVSGSAESGELVYRDNLLDDEGEVFAQSFLLKPRGTEESIMVEVNPARLRVIADPNMPDDRNDSDATSIVGISVGDAVTVIGRLQSSGGPFRGQAWLSAEDDKPLTVLFGSTSYQRRLLIAAVTELLAAVALLGAAGLLCIVRIALG